MTSFSQGKYALMISDRSGLAFPYNEMVREWNGAWVHSSEFEKNLHNFNLNLQVLIHKLCNMQDHQEQLCQHHHHWTLFLFQLPEQRH